MARLSDSHNDDRGAAGQRPLPHHHRGWQTRERTASGSARSPLRESPASNRDGSAADPRKVSSSKSLRPYDIPSAPGNGNATAAVNTTAGTTASAEAGKVPGTDDKGIVLRCMYTTQKTKKRKTWSDGAVKCCPQRQRVSLYRWSEALGVTEKLLGEVYLTVPQYEAFITQGEPELEMELYIVSLDGVIQPDDNASGGGAGSAATPAENTAATGVSACGGTTAAAGKKRKLFKAFKPPARREPTSAPQPDDSWGRLPPGGVGLRGNRDRGGDGRFPPDRGGGQFSPRTTYTGFGHVESLWDEDEEQEGQDRREDGAGLAGEHGAGWGMEGAAGPGYQNPYDGGNELGALREARSEEAVHPPYHRSTGTSAVGNTNAWMWGPPAGEHSLDGPPRPSRSTADFTSGSPGQQQQQQQQERGRHDETAVSGHHRDDDPSSYLESLRRGDDDDDDAGGRSASHYPENQRCGRDGAVTSAGGTSGTEESTFGRGNAIGASARVPEVVDRETPGDGARVEMRSTQDILSLFGGFGGTPSTPGGHDHGSQERETAESQRHGPPEAPLGSQVSGNALMPVGGGIRRAADMRRAQKEARAAAATAAPDGGVAGAPNEDAVSGDWACGTCGVRGDPSSASCRVCGAKRQGLRSDGVAQGGDDGVRGGIGSQERRVGWGRGDDFGGGGRRQEQASEGGAGDVGDRPVTLGLAGGLEAEGATGRWRTSSPDRHALPRSGTGSGGEGACGSSALETPSNCRKISPRMQMDMGSSSDSDDA